METASLILSIISTLAAVVSAVVAVSAKHDVKTLKNHINGNHNLQNSGRIDVNSTGENHGVVSGVNTGEIRK